MQSTEQIVQKNQVNETLAARECFSLEESIIYQDMRPPEWVWQYAVPQIKPESSDDQAVELVAEEVEKAYKSGLPPEEYRLVDPQKVQFRTPLNEKGEVDQAKLIQLVRATVHPLFPWDMKGNLHHFYWPRANYEALGASHSDLPALQYRNLAVNKAELPLLLHNWLHAVTMPPTMPPTELITYRVNAWKALTNLYHCVSKVLMERRRHERLSLTRTYDEEQETIIDLRMRRQLAGIAMHVTALVEEVPSEFWPVTDTLRIQQAAGHIGGIVRGRGQRFTRTLREDVYSKVA